MAETKGKKLTDKLQVNEPVAVEFMYGGKKYQEEASNLLLRDLTPEQIRIALNRAPSKYAYWGNLQAEISKELDDVKSQFDFWYAAKYEAISAENAKLSETAKKQAIMLEYPREYKKHLDAIRELDYVCTKINILIKAYDMQSRTLQTVASLLRAEMERLDQ